MISAIVPKMGSNRIKIYDHDRQYHQIYIMRTRWSIKERTIWHSVGIVSHTVWVFDFEFLSTETEIHNILRGAPDTGKWMATCFSGLYVHWTIGVNSLNFNIVCGKQNSLNSIPQNPLPNLHVCQLIETERIMAKWRRRVKVSDFIFFCHAHFTQK